jgi:hypothetical protein
MVRANDLKVGDCLIFGPDTEVIKREAIASLVGDKLELA